VDLRAGESRSGRGEVAASEEKVVRRERDSEAERNDSSSLSGASEIVTG
jgi:hypothetical protein